jgi:hypothetical protein
MPSSHNCLPHLEAKVGHGAYLEWRTSKAIQADGQPSSTILRTGRQLAPSMPVSSSTLPARPPQPGASWRILAMMSRISMLLRTELVSENTVSSPHRSHTTRKIHDGNARRGSFNLNPAVAFDLRAGFAARHNHCERFRPAQVAAADQVDALSGSVSAPR